MELKWLEDLLCVVEKGHFARAAEERNITQSAFSRRIKSLELWVGTELLDRSHHPVTLTPAGEEFISIAQQIVREAYHARADASEYARIAQSGVTIACLHTLALFQVPSFVAQLRKQVGQFEAYIVADARTVDEYLTSLYNGTSDFFMCYRHPAFPFEVDIAEFPRFDIGADRMMPYMLSGTAPEDLLQPKGKSIPFLEFGGTAFMSRVVSHALNSAPFSGRLQTVYRATLAESLSTAALHGLGLAWLPESVVKDNPRAKDLVCVDESLAEPMQMSIFKAATNTRPVVNRIWDQLAENATAQTA